MLDVSYHRKLSRLASKSYRLLVRYQQWSVFMPTIALASKGRRRQEQSAALLGATRRAGQRSRS